MRKKIYSIYEGLWRKFFKLLPHKGFNPLEDTSWKNLIVLDACRYDVFARLNRIKGNLQKKISNASDTLEWAKKNLKTYYPDTILIASNPQLSAQNLKEKLGFTPFKHIEPVWDYGWDKYVKTVFPQTVIESTLKLKKKYRDERFIIWFMQPHHPFIGNPMLLDGKEIVWDKLKAGKISKYIVFKAYIGNLKLVLSQIEKYLLPELEGKTVITSDHGNLFGEFGLYAHPYGIYLKPLVEVPWFEVRGEKYE